MRRVLWRGDVKSSPSIFAARPSHPYQRPGEDEPCGLHRSQNSAFYKTAFGYSATKLNECNRDLLEDSSGQRRRLDNFILKLIRSPELPGKINDIVVECGNSLYQETLDRYIAGYNVPLDEVRHVWRNTTQPMCSVSAFYEELFPCPQLAKHPGYAH